MTDQITYIGHATLLIELDGVRLLTDPLLRHRITFLQHTRRTGFQSHVAAPPDAVLISHLHYDHLDLPSLRRLGVQTRLVVPRGAGAWLRQAGFTQVEEIGVDESIQVGALTVTATYAEHDALRPRLGGRPPLRAEAALGYLIRGRQTLYFAGDTDCFPAMAELAAGVPGGLEVALLPVWGWGPTLGVGHMDPRRAAEALALLQPRLAIQIHWGALHPLGMGLLKPGFLSIPPRLFAKWAAELAPQVQVEIVPPGGVWMLAGPPGDQSPGYGTTPAEAG